jgi:hypothetical protein
MESLIDMKNVEYFCCRLDHLRAATDLVFKANVALVARVA